VGVPLHDAIVDGDAVHLVVQLDEALGVGAELLQGRPGAREVLAVSVAHGLDGEHEHARVPQVLAPGDVARGELGVGLLDEAAHPQKGAISEAAQGSADL
jgi:hypothetical protein